jgi:hypothetical protein
MDSENAALRASTAMQPSATMAHNAAPMAAVARFRRNTSAAAMKMKHAAAHHIGGRHRREASRIPAANAPAASSAGARSCGGGFANCGGIG